MITASQVCSEENLNLFLIVFNETVLSEWIYMENKCCYVTIGRCRFCKRSQIIIKKVSATEGNCKTVNTQLLTKTYSKFVIFIHHFLIKVVKIITFNIVRYNKWVYCVVSLTLGTLNLLAKMKKSILSLCGNKSVANLTTRIKSRLNMNLVESL